MTHGFPDRLRRSTDENPPAQSLTGRRMGFALQAVRVGSVRGENPTATALDGREKHGGTPRAQKARAAATRGGACHVPCGGWRTDGHPRRAEKAAFIGP